MAREYNYRNFVQVCAMAQAVIHRLLDRRNRVSTQAIPYGICGEQWQGCTNFYQISRSHLKILCAGKMTVCKFHTGESKMSGAILRNLVAMTNWCPEIVHPCTVAMGQDSLRVPPFSRRYHSPSVH